VRLLVTGAAGFIGSHYVRCLLGGRYPAFTDAEVTVLDKLTYSGNLDNLEPVVTSPRYQFVQGDIADNALLEDLVPGHDVILNFAAESHVDRSIEAADAFVTTNIVGTQRLLDAALRHGTTRYVQVSTDEVYGSIDQGSWTEASPLEPNSPYSAAKASGDLFARAYHRTHGLPIIVTRCSNNYGPYQFPEKVIPLFVTNLIDGLSVPLYGDGLNVRDWLHVDDHCLGIQTALERGEPGNVYNIGGGGALTNRELTERLLAAMGAGWDAVEMVEDRKGHDRRYSVDDSRLRALGYAPRHNLEQGLYETIQWYRDNEAWWRPLKKGLGGR
jgi:dTDP-glucose 4,6-dehydratase